MTVSEPIFWLIWLISVDLWQLGYVYVNVYCAVLALFYTLLATNMNSQHVCRYTLHDLQNTHCTCMYTCIFYNQSGDSYIVQSILYNAQIPRIHGTCKYMYQVGNLKELSHARKTARIRTGRRGH